MGLQKSTKALEKALCEIELEYPCGRCGHTGEEMHGCKVFPCIACHGAGFVPTEFGEKILNLLRNNTRDACE